jgi:hypothetical protein
MTRTAGRAHERPWIMLAAAIVTMACLALMASHADGATKRKRHAPSPIAKVAIRPALDVSQATPLPYSDEFDRAELIERMLTECRGVSYNAYELAQTSGESLWLPAPTQLLVVRVRHPYCAELLRTYAQKTRT